MQDLSQFHAIADATLMHLHDQMENAYEEGDIEDLELAEGVLTVETDAATFVISKHSPSGQIWLASPFSGGLHFNYSATQKEWLLDNGDNLKHILQRDLERAISQRIIF